MNGLGQRSAGTDAMTRQGSYMKTASSTTTLTFIDHPRPFRVLPRSPHHRSDRSSKPSPDTSSTTGSSGRLLSGLRRSISTGSQPLPPQHRRRSLSGTSACSAGTHPPLPLHQRRLPETDVRRTPFDHRSVESSPHRSPSYPAPRRRPGTGRQCGSTHGGHDGDPGRRHDPAASHP